MIFSRSIHLSKNYMNSLFLIAEYIFLPEDPAIPLLGIYPEDVPTFNNDTCSTMFIAA